MSNPATYRVEIVGGVAVITVMAVHLRSQGDIHQVRDDILAWLQDPP